MSPITSMSQVSSPRSAAPIRKVGRHRIRKAIERMILDGRIQPGQKLVQSRLAKKFGVSQGLIREALFELKENGLVETADNRGMFVRSLDPERIREIFVIREVFDGVAARECCGRMSAQDAAKLRKMADDIFKCALENRQTRRAELDRRFHIEIARLSGNRVLWMWTQQHHIVGKVMGDVTAAHAQETHRQHHAIIDAIFAGDRAQAEKVARIHVLEPSVELQQAWTSGQAAVLWLRERKPRKRSRHAK